MKRAKSLLTAAALLATISGASLFVLSHADSGDGESGTPAVPGKRRVPVLTAPATEMEFVRGVAVAGEVVSVRHALVSARVPGNLDEVLVDEGDEVRAGKTVLFRTDSLNLGNAVEMARRGEEVAVCAVRKARADCTRLTAIHGQAKADVERYRRLAATGAATAHQLEQMETKYRETAATLTYAHAIIDLALAQQSQAASRRSIAEKNLSDSVVRAPIDGRVVARLHEPGEMAGAGTPVLRIEDHRRLEITAFIPEEYYGDVVPGKTTVRAQVGGTDLGSIPITFRGPVVHPTLRNFEVKAIVPNAPTSLVPGRLVVLTVVLDSHRGIGLPRSALLVREGGQVVFVLEGGVARMLPVRIGLPTDGHVEVLGDGLSEGDEIIIEGQSWLDDGTPVIRVKED